MAECCNCCGPPDVATAQWYRILESRRLNFFTDVANCPSMKKMRLNIIGYFFSLGGISAALVEKTTSTVTT